MIGSTDRLRLLQSAVNNRFRQRSGKRPLGLGLFGAGKVSAAATAAIVRPTGFYQTNRLDWLPNRSFFSSNNNTNNDKNNNNNNNSTLGESNSSTTTKATRFEDLNLHPLTLKALQRQGIHRQTEIQEKTHYWIRTGSNVVARSRTGTGKTLAFLVPSIERYLLAQQQQQQQRRQADVPFSNYNKIRGIPILVLAPTRELAVQIGKEAEKLVLMHKKQQRGAFQSLLSSQVVYGGSSKKEDITKFHREGLPTILVATPGRLKDHLATTILKLPRFRTNNASDEFDEEIIMGGSIEIEKYDRVPFRSALQNGNLRTLVLDETDRLLEMGFRRDVQDILSCLDHQQNTTSPFQSTQNHHHQQQRQTLLFSATLAPGIMDVVDLAMAPSDKNKITNESRTKNYEMIDCVREEDLTTHTNANTSQSYIVLPPERFWTGSIEFILQLMTGTANLHDSGKSNKKNSIHKMDKKKKHKIIVFFEMTRLAQLYSKFLSLRLGHTLGVWELHGKMHQKERTIVTRRFRNASHGVLLTSDVSARGVDYPDVTHVVQVGAPQNRETYIHRLGRTGRAGKDGAGVLVIPEYEQNFVSEELGGLGLVNDGSGQKGLLSKKATKESRGVRKELENELGMLRHDLQSGRDHTGMAESLTLAYHSLVSYYFQTRRRRRRTSYSKNSSTELPQSLSSSSLEATVKMLNQLIQDFGLPELPAIGFQRAKSMGIDHLYGHLNIRKDWEDQNWNISAADSDKHSGGGFDDDWFGIDRDSSPPKEASFRRPKKGNGMASNSVVESSNSSTKQKPTRTKQTKTKKKEGIAI